MNIIANAVGWTVIIALIVAGVVQFYVALFTKKRTSTLLLFAASFWFVGFGLLSTALYVTSTEEKIDIDGIFIAGCFSAASLLILCGLIGAKIEAVRK